MPRPRLSPERGHTHTLFARARADKMHFHIHKRLYTEIYKKNAAPQSEHSEQAPAFTPTARTPQCGHTVWGNYPKNFPQKYNAPKADPLKKTFQLKSAMPQSKAHQFLPCLNLLPCQHHERIFREDLKRAHMNKLKVFEAKIVQISAEIWFQFCIYTKIKIFHIQLI